MKTNTVLSKSLLGFIFMSAFLLTGCQRLMTRQPAEGPAIETPSESEVIDTSGIAPGQPIPMETPVSGVQPEVQSENYRLYDPLAVEEYAKIGRPVLFFHAQWCPTCKAINEEIGQRYSEIPKDVVIFKVDYDTYTNLKTQYGITYQHTFVILDEELNEVKKWNGGDFNKLLEELNTH